MEIGCRDAARCGSAFVAKARLATLLTLMLAGCAAQPGDGPSIGERMQKAIDGARVQPGAQAAASTFPAELDGLFKKHPITNAQRPETWPRLAITITGAAPGVFQTVSMGNYSNLGASDCVTYKIKLWTSAKDAKSFDNLKLCPTELYARVKSVPLYQVPTWGRRAFFIDEKTTGAVRTDGPTPPADHFPTDPTLQNLWLDQYRNTIFFVGGMLVQLGFDWNNVNDKRVWFVSVPAKT